MLRLDDARTRLTLGCMLMCCGACKHSEIWLGAPAHAAAAIMDSGAGLPVSDSAHAEETPFEDASAVQPDAGSALDAGGAAATDAAAIGGATSLSTDAAAGSADAPELPAIAGACPKLESGTIRLLGVSVRLWVGTALTAHQAPLVLYWHGTGSDAGEVAAMWTQTLPDILAEGGIVASFQDSVGTGDNSSGTGTWYTGDFAVADQLVACTAAQREIDPRRIYAAGCSAGALQAATIAVSRSNYIAAAITNSGGKVLAVQSQRPSRVPAAMTVHGSQDDDVVIINFAEASLAYDQELAQKGGFAIDCDHGGGHCGAPQTYVRAQWTFLKDHPFGVSPEPYARALPAEFPSSCRIIGP